MERMTAPSSEDLPYHFDQSIDHNGQPSYSQQFFDAPQNYQYTQEYQYLPEEYTSDHQYTQPHDLAAHAWGNPDQYQYKQQGLLPSGDEKAGHDRTELAFLKARSLMARAVQEQSASKQNFARGSSGAFKTLQPQAAPQVDFGWPDANAAGNVYGAQQNFEQTPETTYTPYQPAAVHGSAMNISFGLPFGEYPLQLDAAIPPSIHSAMPSAPSALNEQYPLPLFNPTFERLPVTGSFSANLPRSPPSLPALSSRRARRTKKGEPMQQSTSPASVGSSQASAPKVNGPRHKRTKDDYSVEAFPGLTAAEILRGGKDGIQIQSHDIDGPVIVKVAQRFSNEDIHDSINRLRAQEGLEALSYSSATKRISNSLKKCANSQGYTSPTDVNEWKQA